MKDMKLTRAQAVAVFTEIGFRTSDKWDNDRLNKKLETLHEMVDGSEEIASKETKELFKQILETRQAGAAVTIADDDAPAAKEKPAKKEAAEEQEEAPAPKAKAEKPAPKKDPASKAVAAVKGSDKKVKAEKPAKEKPVAKPAKASKDKSTYIDQVKDRKLREGSQLYVIAEIFKASKTALKPEDVVAAAKKNGTKITEARVRGAIWILQKRGEVVAGKEDGFFKRA